MLPHFDNFQNVKNAFFGAWAVVEKERALHRCYQKDVR